MSLTSSVIEEELKEFQSLSFRMDEITVLLIPETEFLISDPTPIEDREIADEIRIVQKFDLEVEIGLNRMSKAGEQT